MARARDLRSTFLPGGAAACALLVLASASVAEAASYRISLADAGVYRVTYDDLVRAGASKPLPSATLGLSNQGQPVPIRVHDGGRRRARRGGLDRVRGRDPARRDRALQRVHEPQRLRAVHDDDSPGAHEAPAGAARGREAGTRAAARGAPAPGAGPGPAAPVRQPGEEAGAVALGQADPDRSGAVPAAAGPVRPRHVRGRRRPRPPRVPGLVASRPCGPRRRRRTTWSRSA